MPSRLLKVTTPGTRKPAHSETTRQVDDLIRAFGADPATRDGRLVRDLVLTALGLGGDDLDTGELKLLSTSLAEMRRAYRVFAGYRDTLKISIFGSARTPEDHPDYQCAVQFSRVMSQRGWSVITGAGDGIMKAGHEGPGAQTSFGLSIGLPFETSANEIIAGDPKLLRFRYFFARKLMFLSQCHAVVAFPGGFGTQDELLECLTLVQTGKSAMIPIVLLAGPGSTYWRQWESYVRAQFLANGFIAPEDVALYHLARDEQDAADHVCRFYANYHSSRYVREYFVIRIRRPVTTDQLAELNRDFADLVSAGRIRQRDALPEEQEYPELPRVVFRHTRRQYGRLRQLIDRLNDFSLGDGNQ